MSTLWVVGCWLLVGCHTFSKLVNFECVGILECWCAVVLECVGVLECWCLGALEALETSEALLVRFSGFIAQPDL